MVAIFFLLTIPEHFWISTDDDSEDFIRMKQEQAYRSVGALQLRVEELTLEVTKVRKFVVHFSLGCTNRGKMGSMEPIKFEKGFLEAVNF